MAHAQSSLHDEIQTLRDALSASENKVARYARTIATLTVELEDLRNSICHSCRNKLASSNASVPSITISAGQASTGATASVTVPLWRRVFEGRRRSHPTIDNVLSIGLSRSLAASPNTNTPLPVPSESEVAHYRNSSQTTPTSPHPGPNEGILSPEQKPTPLNWSVVYNPDIEQALDLRLAHALPYDSTVYCIKMSPDGQRLAVGLGGIGKTYINELETGSKCCIFVDRYVKDRIDIMTVQFSLNGKLLATGASDGQIRIWDITVKRMRAMLKGHEGTVSSVAFSPNGRSLVSASHDGSVRIWNIRDGSSKVLHVIITGSPAYHFRYVVCSPDKRYIAAGNSDNSLWIWHSRTHRLVAKLQWGQNFVWCTAFTPDGKGLMSGSHDKTVKYWDVSLLGSRQEASTGMVVNEEQRFPLVWSFLGHDSPVLSIALFPDNAQWIVTGSSDSSVRVWDTDSGVCQLTLKGHTNWVFSVDVSPTQNVLATAGYDGYVTVWKYKKL